jgi:hypothetical protein
MAPIPKYKTQPATVPTFDEALIRTHCEMLHSLAAGIDGVLVISAFLANPLGEKDSPSAVSHCRIGDVDGMVEAVMAHTQTPNANVFAGLQVMRKGLTRGSRGLESDIIAVLGLVADMDGDTGRLGTLPVEADLVLETSPGNSQPFILFDRPLPPSEAKTLALALKRATGSDHGTGDVAHVWRIPGCLNWPNKKKLERGRPPEPAAVTVTQPWAGSLTNIDDLRAAFEPWSQVPVSASAISLGNLPSVEGITASENAAALLAANEVGDRSEHAARVVEQLAFDGLSAEQAASLFLTAEGDWILRYPTEERATKDFERMWGKFGVPLIEERAEQTARAQHLAAAVTRKADRVAANDNSALPTSTPNMHPNPFTPEAAGGLLAEIATWVNSTAIVPVKELSLAAAIALLGGCFGKSAIGPTNAGVNVYFCTLLGTAGGKGWPPKAIRTLGDLCGAQGAVSNGDPTSYSRSSECCERTSQPSRCSMNLAFYFRT